MTKKSLISSFFLSFFLISAFFVPAEAQEKHAAVIKINDVITPAIADFISRSIEQATKEKAACLIIQMDTPGGLDLSMRDIIKDIMNAEIPSSSTSDPAARAPPRPEPSSPSRPTSPPWPPAPISGRSPRSGGRRQDGPDHGRKGGQ